MLSIRTITPSFFLHAILSVSLTLSLSPVSAQPVAHIQSDHLLKVNLLFIGAHPDDESGVTATFGREVLDHGARAAVVLATRGEGGGNGIGKELGPALGLLREAELRRATATYGVDLVYFLDKTDFFYTLSCQAAFDVWHHDDALRRLVRLVRLLRPDVIVTMWPGPGTHGQHQAAARLATEAFTAAADSTIFPEQLTDEFLRPWQPLKLYYNTDRNPSLRVPVTDISPGRFMSYGEIKALALRNYRSQGFDRFALLPPQRSEPESFLLVTSLVPTSPSATSLLDGITAPVNRALASPSAQPLAPLDVRIAPRRDVAEFRRWAAAQGIDWLVGLLPAEVSVGIGMADTVAVIVENHRDRRVDGTITLTLPTGFTADARAKPYDLPAGKTTRLPFVVTVPSGLTPGAYDITATTTVDGKTIADAGKIDALPVMILTRSARPLVIDGNVADWAGVPVHLIPSTALWSGRLPGGDADCSGTFRAGYDAEYLYVAVEVTDDVVVCNIAPDDIKGHWRTDSVEICVDPSGRSEHTLTVFKTGIFPGTTAGRQARAERDADANQGVIEKTAPGMRVASSFTKTGYLIETAIPWRDMPGGVAPASGQMIGLNAIIYDGDDTRAGVGANIEKARLAWSFWPSAQALPYLYGRAILK
ncbi:MAG: PIG-L family deacetylase [Candidatus Latescibacteria bacterium]|nr:PIG-L family deacetylase [Candidatus Latescibacterota bacterium]